jgi:beta-N-acetylhexosaminidase
VGFVLAAELLAHGVDLSFAPVLDLDYGDRAVVGDRSFGRDPQTVAVLAQAVCAGLREAGMASVGKHFPGHGFAQADSHVAMPEDERAFEEIWQEDIAPYRGALRDTLAAVMPAHVVYPACDANPAGFSAFWLQDVLRTRVGFAGAIFSDDLSMEGATRGGGIVERAQRAYEAGCDMVLVCNRPELADELLAGWTLAVREASSARIAALCPTHYPAMEVLSIDKRFTEAWSRVQALG